MMKWLSILKKDELLRHIGILFSGMTVVHLCNAVYQMAVSRCLPKEEYALLMAFLGVLAILQRPLSTLTTSSSHYCSLLGQDDRLGDVARFVRKWLFLTGIPAVMLGVIMIVFSQHFSAFLHLDRTAPVVIIGAILPAVFCLPVLSGAAQGLQFFGWSNASTIAGALCRLGLGAGFVWFLYPACGWAMLGHGMGIYISAMVLLLSIFWLLKRQAGSSFPLPSMRFYLIQSFVVQAAYAVLMTADVIFVKHFLPFENDFAYAATLGRMVILVPGIIVVAMFPKVASRGKGTSEQTMIFSRSLAYTALFIVVAIGGCFVFSDLLVRILFGITDCALYLKQLLWSMAFVMGISALLNVTMQFLVAQRRFKSTTPVLVCSLLYIVSVGLFHETPEQIIRAAGIFNGLALVILLVIIRMEQRIFSNKKSLRA